MKRSTQRILTTHTGSLPRPTDVVELLLHEQKHVRDNERIMSRMDAARRADSQFVAILVNPNAWLPRAQFGATQQTIQARVGAVFTRLTQAAAQALDTRQEYANTDTQVRIRCNASVGSVLLFDQKRRVREVL